MKRKSAILVPIICFLMILTACGGGGTSSSIDAGASKAADSLTDIQSQIGESKPVTRSSGMNEEELLTDLNNQSSFFEWFSPNAGFAATSIQINHRNTEKKESDEIYATATSTNEYSSYTAEFYLCYRYYSEGGWRLETLSQSDDGIYSINRWPQEDELYAVWDNKYAEMYNNGVIAQSEVEETGNDYIMYLVTYFRESDFSVEFSWAEVLFRFENGLWTTASMEYPAGHVWSLKADSVCGTYLSTAIEDNNMRVWLLNLHTDGSDNTKLWTDFYEYIVDYVADTNSYDFYSAEDIDRATAFDLSSIHMLSTNLYYNGGDWRNGAERIDSSNSSLTRDRAHSVIQQLVEENGFPYLTDSESNNEDWPDSWYEDNEFTE